MILWDNKSTVLATTGQAYGPDWQCRTKIAIDSRTLQKGDLFLAIKGARFDGHHFVAQAFAKGACAAILSEIPAGMDKNESFIVVDDTLDALYKLAAFARARSRATIIGITGSYGKTTTKEMLKTALQVQALTYANAGNFNNHIGLPLSLANVSEDRKFAVFEIGMNHANEIKPLSRLLKPDIAVITTVDAVHLENFLNIEEIVDAKNEIFAGLSGKKIAILNQDNPYINKMKDAARQAGAVNISTVGYAASADYSINAYVMPATLTTPHLTLPMDMPKWSRHHLYNSALALTVVDLCRQDTQKAALAIGKMSPLSGRGHCYEVNHHDKQYLVIDESYNASPASMRSALDNLASLGKGRRKVAVLGDMLELGENAVSFHQQLALPIVDLNIELVYTTGKLMKSLYQELPKHIQGKHFSTSEELADFMSMSIKHQDVIMVKGSNSMNMQHIVNKIT